MKKLLIVLSLLAMTGCMSSKKPYPLVETNYQDVRECKEVARFRSEVGYRMWGPPPVIGDFKYQSAVKAKAMGATHIYWRTGGPGMEGALNGWAVDCTGVQVDDMSGMEGYE